jgi:hypothetical protein
VHACRHPLLPPCAWSPRFVLAVALSGSAARLATLLWARLALAILHRRYRCPRASLPWRRCCGGPAPCRPCLAVASSLGRWLPWPCWHDTVWARRATCGRMLSRWGNSSSLPYQLSPAATTRVMRPCRPSLFFRHRRHGPAFEPYPVSTTSCQFAVGVGSQRPGPPPPPCM